VKIKFWGARGSIPTPSTMDFVTSRYGGNTTCISVEVGDLTVILDGGSGLRNLGLELSRRMPLKAVFFFSHVHWDHIQGFPFFIPCFVPGNEFNLYGAAQMRDTGVVGSILENALRGQQRSLNFPVQISNLPAKLSFHEMGESAWVKLPVEGGEVAITSCALNHPGGCFGYRIEDRTGPAPRVFVLATDNEHFPEGLNPNLQKIAKDADVLVYDAQYTMDEYEGKGGMPRKGWGHSTWVHGLQEAEAAGVKRLILTHHDPMHDDWAIARIENDARKEGLKLDIQVDAAYEGLTIDL